MFDLSQLEHAHEVVAAAMPPTAAHAWPLLAQRLGAEVVVKHENHTPIGAFKVRGGLVYVDRLKRERPGTAGLISATRGNQLKAADVLGINRNTLRVKIKQHQIKSLRGFS